jgi:hypothetical protein
VSSAEQPFDVRITLTQEEAVDFLERLARNENGILDRYPDDPLGVLRDNGIEVTATKAPPPDVTAPSPEDLEAAVAYVRDEEWWWPWIWWLIPWIGRTPREKSEGYETA